MNDFWIIDPLNHTFFLLLALMALLVLIISAALKGKTKKTKQLTIAAIYLCDIVIFIVYKYYISLDTQYYLDAGLGTFSWWNELPLHLCNVCMMLLPIAVLTDNKRLLTLCSFVSFPGPFMSMLIPAYGFAGVSIFVPRVAGFWITHALILTAGPLLAINGLYVPKFKDIPKNAVTLLCIAMAIFGIDVLFRASGLNPVANYFYLMSPEKNPLLELLYSFVPVPLLYILPFGAVVCMIMFILHATVYTLAVKVLQIIRKNGKSDM